MKKNLIFNWYYDTIEHTGGKWGYGLLNDGNKWGYRFYDITNGYLEEEELWFDSLLEAVQAAQEHYDKKTRETTE